MNEAIFNTQEIVEVRPEAIEELKELARQAARRRFRLCLHRDLQEAIHEMVVVCCHDSYIAPHRHAVGKTESYHMIEGELLVLLFDNEGNVIRRVELSVPGSGKPFMFRLATSVWHMPVPQSDVVVYHETFKGPFRSGLDAEYASWCPSEKDIPGVAGFLAKIQRGDFFNAI